MLDAWNQQFIQAIKIKAKHGFPAYNKVYYGKAYIGIAETQATSSSKIDYHIERKVPKSSEARC